MKSTKNSNAQSIIIFPHQLFQHCPLLDDHPPKNTVIYLVEEFLFFRQYNFHKQKLVLHRASMMQYADYLRSKDYKVIYVDSSEFKNRTSLKEFFTKHNIKEIAYTYTVDDWLEKSLNKICTDKKISVSVYDTPMFLTTNNDLVEYKTQTKQPYFMKHFYQWQRQRLGILVDDNNKPTGGKWSYDTENRKKLPKDITLPSIKKLSKNNYVDEAIRYVEKNFPDNVGSVSHFNYSINFTQAKNCMNDFIENKLADFGPYEDAIDQKNHTLFHSVLSPYLNIGLIQPAELLDAVIDYSKHNPSAIPLPSLEGFVRQVIGWREYMRLVYQDLGVTIRNSNYFKATRTVPYSFWNATTGIQPIDHTVQTLLDHAYCHHIPRLMIMGNFMNLCGFHPDQVYRWFMEMFIDSYDWVMVANVYSMALYADGGLITTKPYISGSNYVLKMSDYKKGEWSDTWDALFWNFVGKHFKQLSTEGRLGFIGLTYQKMSQEKKDLYSKKAKEFLGLLKDR